jgi:CotH kinase protein
MHNVMISTLFRLFSILCLMQPLLLGYNPLFAQSGLHLFDDTQLHEIRLSIAIPYWQDTLYKDYIASNKDPENIPEFYRKCENVSIDGASIGPVGIKMKGNFSVIFNRAQQRTKFPFKISFDAFFNQKYDGLRKINLNTNTNDPSFMREAMAYRLFRDADIAAPRTAFTKLYVNDEYMGLFSLVENVDKTFLKHNFGSDDDGNLYKGITSDFSWSGFDKSAYKKELSLKTNETEDDWTRLIAFFNLINNGSKQSIKDSLVQVFELDQYLKIAAIERLIFSWDSYTGSGSNYYVYESENGKIRWIPWDYNETFQVANGKINPSFLVPRNNRPLLKSIFEDKEWRQQYMGIVCEMLENKMFSVEKILPQIKNWYNLIDQAYKEEKNPLFDYSVFQQSLSQSTEEYFSRPQTGFQFKVITYNGFFPFVKERIKWAKEQLRLQRYNCAFEPVSEASTSLLISPNPIRSGQKLRVEQLLTTQPTRSAITVFDVMGRVIEIPDWQFEKDGVQYIIVDQWPKGMYFLCKQEADGTIGMGKLVVE